VIVVASIFSLKVAVMDAFRATPVERLPGPVTVTVGAIPTEAGAVGELLSQAATKRPRVRRAHGAVRRGVKRRMVRRAGTVANMTGVLGSGDPVVR
jgi:hypothetical protein